MVAKDTKEILIAEFISITGGLFAGTMLSFAVDKIYLIPGLLILLPGFLEMRGNISGSLSARLSAGLFLGAISSKFTKHKVLHLNPIKTLIQLYKFHSRILLRDRILRGNVIASFVLVIFTSLFLGVFAYLTSLFFFGIVSQKIIFVALLASVLSNIIEIPLTTMTTFWLFRHGYDPNNIMGPYVTTTGDIISILSLLLAIVII